jgi:hypothetical protein
MLNMNDNSRQDTVALMAEIGRKARAAARPLAIASPERKHAALVAMAEAIVRGEAEILNANAIDMANGEEAGLSPAMLDRLKLDPQRIRAIAEGWHQDDCGTARPGGRCHRRLGPPQRPAHRACAHAARRHRRDL